MIYQSMKKSGKLFHQWLGKDKETVGARRKVKYSLPLIKEVDLPPAHFTGQFTLTWIWPPWLYNMFPHFAAESTKPSSLLQHFETKYPYTTNKHEGFSTLRENLKSWWKTGGGPRQDTLKLAMLKWMVVKHLFGISLNCPVVKVQTMGGKSYSAMSSRCGCKVPT